MIRLLDLESAIISRLTAALTLPEQTYPKVEVRAWPERPGEYRMTHPHGAVLLAYKGSGFNRSRSTAGHLVDVLVDFELAVLSRSLREPNAPERRAALGVGAYDLLDTCRTALMGWQPDQASDVVSVTRESYDDYAEGVWGFHQSFSIPMTQVVDRSCPAGPWAFDGENACCSTAPALSQAAFIQP